MRRVTENRYPAEGGYYSVLKRIGVSGIAPANRAKAAETYRLAMTPPTRDMAEEWVAMLHAATAHRTEGEGGLTVALDLYANALRQFPADCARQACLNLATRKQTPNWFPTLSELIVEGERLSEERRLIAESLEHLAATPDRPAPPRVEYDPAPAREAWASERKRIAGEFRALAAQLGGGR